MHGYHIDIEMRLKKKKIASKTETILADVHEFVQMFLNRPHGSSSILPASSLSLHEYYNINTVIT